MENEKNRVLGRVLAVDETQAVSGARPLQTSPSADNSFPPTDTGYANDIIPKEASLNSAHDFGVKAL
jgi:hypothetical protein